MAAGTVTTTEELLGNVKKVTFAWTAGTDGEAGTATGTTTYPYTGNLLKVVTVPGLVADQPTDDYDITIKDEDGVDVGNGQLLNRDDTNTEWVIASLGAVVGDKLTFAVTSAGAGKKGVCYAYIGITPIGDEDTAIEDALYGTTGIAAFPAAAAAANNVSLAEVIRYIQASQIGSLANTGGVATLAAILGDPANVSLATSIGKITGAATGGLAVDANNSLAYRVAEIERHLHNYPRWFGVAAAPSGTHKADAVGQAIAPFVIDGGNKVYGTWVQILGSDDTAQRYDLHKLIVTATETASIIHFIQVGFGVSGAQALSDGTYSEVLYRSVAAASNQAPIEIMTRRQAAGTSAWARVLAYETNTSTVSFYFGLHAYEG